MENYLQKFFKNEIKFLYNLYHKEIILNYNQYKIDKKNKKYYFKLINEQIHNIKKLNKLEKRFEEKI